jgi:hypothetical protein
MPDPTGRWINRAQWQCPKCGWVNGSADERCQKCAASVRPRQDEPARPPDPLDVIGHRESAVEASSPVQLAAKAIQTVTRVTRDKATALIGEGLRTGLRKRGQEGDRALRAIAEMPEDDRRAALGSLVDDLEEEGFALYRIDEDDRGESA